MIDITFHANTEYVNSDALLAAQETSLIYITPFTKWANVEVIKHFNNPSMQVKTTAGYRFFPGKNTFGYTSLHTLRYIKEQRPDVILVRGLIFPIQVFLLRLVLGKKVKIIARHHADRPFKLKRFLQVLADKCLDAYLFTSSGNAAEWIYAGIIKDTGKIYEAPATLTRFEKINKANARFTTGMKDMLNYLWVGRLTGNKDPLTVLQAFEVFIARGNQAHLHIIFQTSELLDEVNAMIDKSLWLKSHVTLHGKISYNSLPAWYSAADFYISASHSEGGSSAILEAMACGCIPIVSNIPASMNVIHNGKYGLFFSPGDAAGLTGELLHSSHIDHNSLASEVEKHYTYNYSPEAVAEKIFSMCRKLLAE